MYHSFVTSHFRFSFTKCSADAKNNSLLSFTLSHTRLGFDEPCLGLGNDGYVRARTSCKVKSKRWRRVCLEDRKKKIERRERNAKEK